MEISQVFCQFDKKNMPAKYLSLEKETYIFKKIGFVISDKKPT